MAERTGTGDPLRTIALLWRTGVKTGRSGLTLDAVVETAIAVAAEVGIDNLSMRRIADRLGVGAMSLYTHVPGKAELIDLMVDHVNGTLYRDADAIPAELGWRSGMETVAERNWRLFSEHRWLLGVDVVRPPLGPGTTAKYDAELSPLLGIGLDDVEVDQVLGLVLEHVRSAARLALGAAETSRATGSSEQEWWERAGPLLATLIDPERYPHAARVGAAAGEAYGAAVDPARAYVFGLRTILDGVEHLIAEKRRQGR